MDEGEITIPADPNEGPYRKRAFGWRTEGGIYA